MTAWQSGAPAPDLYFEGNEPLSINSHFVPVTCGYTRSPSDAVTCLHSFSSSCLWLLPPPLLWPCPPLTSSWVNAVASSEVSSHLHRVSGACHLQPFVSACGHATSCTSWVSDIPL